MILVTGATGQLGTAVIDHLLKSSSADKFVALARSEEKAKGLIDKGVQVRYGDFDNHASIKKSFYGIDKLLLISTASENRGEQQKAIVEIAKEAGVKHIIYTGVALKNVTDSAIKFLMGSHFSTEDAIKEAGLKYTFLRNSLYADVVPMFAGEKVFETGIFLPAGRGKTPFALRREMGEAAANVLIQDGHEDKIYEITANESYDFAEIATILSELSGKQLNYVDADPTVFIKTLEGFGVPEFAVNLVAGFAADIKAHQYEIVSNDLEKLLGRKPADLKTALKEIYHL